MKVECIKVGYLRENCYVISINDNCLIIDPGDEFDKIKKLVGNKKVLGILITHYHFDHVGALDDCINMYNSNVIDYKSDKVQNVGPFNFEIIDTPGHKEDLITYYFKKEKIMFTGDFLFNGTIGRCDLKESNPSDMIDSINKIKKYDKDIMVYPGHGKSTTLGYEMDNNPYLKGDNYE